CKHRLRSHFSFVFEILAGETTMKRFLLIMVSFFSIQSMTCYADPYPTIHFYYSLVLNEDLFAQADENMKNLAVSH
ncbi:MAG: hypothetical protein KDK59_09715, partial [Simkania sp.]|nr:hypothetical protein [Simkania sp.]